MNHLTIETEENFSNLLELAANNDIMGFKQLIELDPSCVDDIGKWYGRQKGSKQMVLQQRTPLMVASTYGSIDIMKLVLSLSESDVNRSCGPDESTALHCAASGASDHALDAVRLLLTAGADPNSVDVNGCRPVDVIVVSPKLVDVKSALEQLLGNNGSSEEINLVVPINNLNLNSPPFSSSPEKGFSDSNSSPKNNIIFNSEKKEYPIDPSFPDIKNSIYSTDEFRMFSFKVRPCSRAYSHDWTECPFVHPGENARRRDPRKFHYSCVPCPDFRKGACRRGDMCEYAHGVFECWLHPAQYRTRLCKDGISCARRVCFFAHRPEELRPLYVSTGSAVPSPRSASLDYAAAMSLLPGSPSSFTPPMSPNGSNGLAWTQQSIPTLNLPGSNLQSSRLRSSLNARDILTEEFNLLSDFDMQQKQFYNELSCLSQSSNALGHSGRLTTLTPSNLENLFLAENSSPRYSDQGLGLPVYSPTHKSNVFSHFQQQQSTLSPINTSFSVKSADHHFPGTFGSPRNMESLSPMGSRVSMLSLREKQQQFRSLSSRELGSNSNSVAGWGSSNGKPDWAVGADDYGGMHRRSSSFEIGNNGEEPDLSWVQSLVKESPTDMMEKSKMPVLGTAGENSNVNPENESADHAKLGAWFKKMQFD